MDKEWNFEVYMESKKLWLNIGNTAKKEFDSACNTRIDDVISQIRRLKEAKVDKQANKYTQGAVFRVALLQIPIVYNKNNAPNDKVLKSAPKNLERLLQGKISRLKAHLLLSVLDMRPFGGCDDENTEMNPFNILAAIVTQ